MQLPLIGQRECGLNNCDSYFEGFFEGLAMKIPVVRGIIDRRILVNYRVDPNVLARLLPKPFQPKLANGSGMAGVGSAGGSFRGFRDTRSTSRDRRTHPNRRVLPALCRLL